jgi:hypothetical protein
MKFTFLLMSSMLVFSSISSIAAPFNKKWKDREDELNGKKPLPADPSPTSAPEWYTWTASGGEKLEARFKALENGIVTIEKRDKTLARFPLNRLNEADQKFAEACKAAKPRAPLSQVVVNQAAARLDETINLALKTNNEPANPKTSDAIFVRRIYLDTIGRIPTESEAREFLDNSSPQKRSNLINNLLNSPGYTMGMYNWLADMLRIKDDYGKGARAFLYEDWLKDQIAMNVPWNAVVRDMLTADGKLNQNGAAGFLLRDAQMPLDGVSNLLTTFLGANVSCAQCHDHPFSDWSQHDFYSIAAYFGATDGFHENVFRKSRMLLKSEELASVNKFVLGQILTPNAYNLIDLPKNQLKFPLDYKYKDAKPGQLTTPSLIRWSDTSDNNPAYDVAKESSDQLRNQFADWMIHPENPRFAAAIANRMWKKVFGLAVQEPVTDIDDLSLASNQELLKQITTYMKQAQFDLREFQRILFHTAAYQRRASQTPEDPKTYRFAGPVIRRMSAEQAWDSIVTLVSGDSADNILLRRGDDLQKTVIADDDFNPKTIKKVATEMQINGIRPGPGVKNNGGNARLMVSFYEGGKPEMHSGLLLARASEIQQPAPENHFLRLFGQSDRMVSDTNTTDGSVPQMLQLMNGPVQDAVINYSTALRSANKQKADSDAITSLYLSFHSRKPTADETNKASAALKDGLKLEDLAWILLNSREFLFLP